MTARFVESHVSQVILVDSHAIDPLRKDERDGWDSTLRIVCVEKDSQESSGGNHL